MDIELIPKEQKEVVAKTLLDLNYSATQIARLLDIDRSTVYRYSKKPIKAELQQYATEIRMIFSVKQHQILAKILKRIDSLVEKNFNLNALISVYKVLNGRTESLFDIHKDSEREIRWDLVDD